MTITADFSRWIDYPLSKTKFSVYNSGWVPLSRYERDIALYDEVKPHSLRVDLWFGGGSWTRQPIGGTSDNIQYDFSELNRLATLLNTHGVLPYWSYSYVPPPLQSTPGDWRSTPTDAKLWGEALGAIARQAREGPPELRIGYHEIYNEPDNRDFFHGDLTDYLEMYREGVRGIRAADPDAVVGGPALAFKDDWVSPFLDAVVGEGLPLDFFSFHYYPDIPRRSPDIAGVVADMRRELAQRPDLATIEMHLNEYNSYRIDYPEGGKQDRYPIASAMLHDFAYFLTQPDLTMVHWAQFQDTAGGNWSGMISHGGHRKALFNAYRIYQTMPVDRREVRVEGPPGIEAMASADAHNAGIVLWNRTSTAQDILVVLNSVPFERGDLRIFRIDSEHASRGDSPANETLQPVEEHRVTSARFAWSGAVPKDGVVYIAADDGSGRSELEPNRLAEVIRILHYYPERGTTSYATFDPDTWTARLGMGSEEQAYELVGVTAEQLPKAVNVRVDTDGVLRKVDANSLLGLRIDYETGKGYVRSVLFHGPCGTNIDLHHPNRTAPMPWGTERAADEVIAVTDLSQFMFSPAEHAPETWTGRAQFSFILHNTGPGTRAKFRLSGE